MSFLRSILLPSNRSKSCAAPESAVNHIRTIFLFFFFRNAFTLHMHSGEQRSQWSACGLPAVISAGRRECRGGPRKPIITRLPELPPYLLIGGSRRAAFPSNLEEAPESEMAARMNARNSSVAERHRPPARFTWQLN